MSAAEKRRAHCISVRPEIWNKIVELSKVENRSVSNLIETLVIEREFKLNTKLIKT